LLNSSSTLKKIEKLQTKTNKKYSLQSLATVTQIRRQEPWTESENTINNLAQVNAYESLSDINSEKNGLGGLPGNGMPMIITNAKKIVLITLRRKKPALETIKDGTDNLK
jgi:hypothetical protein